MANSCACAGALLGPASTSSISFYGEWMEQEFRMAAWEGQVVDGPPRQFASRRPGGVEPKVVVEVRWPFQPLAVSRAALSHIPPITNDDHQVSPA